MITSIKNDEQYDNYCEFLMFLVTQGNMENPLTGELIELLTVLIEDYDERDKLGAEYDPVMIMKATKESHDLSYSELANELDMNDEYHIRQVFKYKQRPKDEFVDKFAKRFKLQRSALTKPYRLDGEHSMDEMFQ